MFKLLKQNIAKSALLGGLTIGGLLLLSISLVKAIFILSSESAVQKAEPKDVVLGTLSLGLTLLALLALLMVQTFLIKKRTFDHKLIVPALIGAAVLMIVGSLMVVTKDHEGWAGDWHKLNDIEKARNDIKSNLILANTLLDDKFGNAGIHPKSGLISDGTNPLFPLGSQITAQAGLQNTLDATAGDYTAFTNQMIQSKSDLAALYPVDELLNVAKQPLISARIVDGMAQAYQASMTDGHAITAVDYFNNTGTEHSYDLKNVINSLHTNDFLTSKLLTSMLHQPVVFTGLTVAYLQGFPIVMTSLILISTTLFGSVYFVRKDLSEFLNHIMPKRAYKGAK